MAIVLNSDRRSCHRSLQDLIAHALLEEVRPLCLPRREAKNFLDFDEREAEPLRGLDGAKQVNDLVGVNAVT